MDFCIVKIIRQEANRLIVLIAEIIGLSQFIHTICQTLLDILVEDIIMLSNESPPPQYKQQKY